MTASRPKVSFKAAIAKATDGILGNLPAPGINTPASKTTWQTASLDTLAERLGISISRWLGDILDPKLDEATAPGWVFAIRRTGASYPDLLKGGTFKAEDTIVTTAWKRSHHMGADSFGLTVIHPKGTAWVMDPATDSTTMRQGPEEATVRFLCPDWENEWTQIAWAAKCVAPEDALQALPFFSPMLASQPFVGSQTANRLAEQDREWATKMLDSRRNLPGRRPVLVLTDTLPAHIDIPTLYALLEPHTELLALEPKHLGVLASAYRKSIRPIQKQKAGWKQMFDLEGCSIIPPVGFHSAMDRSIEFSWVPWSPEGKIQGAPRTTDAIAFTIYQSAFANRTEINELVHAAFLDHPFVPAKQPDVRILRELACDEIKDAPVAFLPPDTRGGPSLKPTSRQEAQDEPAPTKPVVPSSMPTLPTKAPQPPALEPSALPSLESPGQWAFERLQANVGETQELLSSLKDYTLAQDNDRRGLAALLEEGTASITGLLSRITDLEARNQRLEETIQAQPPAPAPFPTPEEIASVTRNPDEGQDEIRAVLVPLSEQGAAHSAPRQSLVLAAPTHQETGASPVDAPIYFTELLSQWPLLRLKALYLDWVLGQGSFKNHRSRRLASGILEGWDQPMFAIPNLDLVGNHDSAISSRENDKTFILRFSHFDNGGTDPWVNIVRLKAVEGGTLVEHGLFRHGNHNFTPGIPSVIRTILPSRVVRYPWEDYRDMARTFHEANVAELVDQLLDQRRRKPIVVVSSFSRTRVPVLNADLLAKELVGIAPVWVEGTSQNSYLLSETLAKRGNIPGTLGVWDGGVRTYFPDFDPASSLYSHPVWTHLYMNRIQNDEARRNTVLRCTIPRAVPYLLPTGFTHAIASFDLDATTLRVASLHGPDQTEERSTAQAEEIASLRTALTQSEQELAIIPDLRRKVAELEGEASIIHELYEEMATELKEAKGDRWKANQKAMGLIIKEDKAATALDPSTTTLFDGILNNSWSETGRNLRVIAARYPDRLVLLPSATSSADDCDYVYPEKVRDLILLLATDYYEAIQIGGDALACRIFGDNYASNEKDLSLEGVRARTFDYRGEPILMVRHLKETRGWSRNANWVFRLHFEWIAAEKKIVIGWCGAHRPL